MPPSTGSQPISGILSVDKGIGWTSHDVVARVRGIAGQRQVGHAGTLDPAATGLLLLVLGQATKLSSYLMTSTKVYCGEVVLGVTTATDDAEAPLGEQRDLGSLSEAEIAAVLEKFHGTIEQTPPTYSAVHHKGQRLYELARRGQEFTPPPRMVRIESIEALCWNRPRLTLRIRCGSGTYIRALARDIGAALGVGGYLHALRRVASGGFTVDEAVSIDTLTNRREVERVSRPVDLAVADLPALALSPSQGEDIIHGRPAAVEKSVRPGPVRLYAPGGELLALGEVSENTVRPTRVFVGA